MILSFKVLLPLKILLLSLQSLYLTKFRCGTHPTALPSMRQRSLAVFSLTENVQTPPYQP